MVVDEVVSVSSGLITELGQIALWMQTLGIIVVLWIIFQIVSFMFNRRRMREIGLIKEDMKRIERKIDRILARNH